MVYAMLSIGVLGFIVWSQMVASPLLKHRLNKFAICLDNLVLWNPFYRYRFRNRKNLHSYIKWAGNLHFYNEIYQLYISIIKNNIIEDPQRLYANNYYKKFFSVYNALFNNKEGKRNYPDTFWLSWLIGFIEGDGAILTYKESLSIVLTQKDSLVLEHIQETLGFGQIHYFEGYSRLIFKNNSDIYLMILLLNGNLVLEKRKSQLKIMIDVFNNKKFKEQEWLSFRLSDKIPFISLSPIISLNDSWLSGFTDAEGCFNVHIVKRKKMKTLYNVSLRFILDQKDEEYVLQNIRILFGFG